MMFASYEHSYEGLDSQRSTFQPLNNNNNNNNNVALPLPLEAFAHSGYLFKKSSSGAWQRRFFEVNGSYLCYYKTHKMTKLLAAINVPHVGQIRMQGEVQDALGTGFVFEIDLKDRQYQLRAESFAEAKKWVDMLCALRDSVSPWNRSADPLNMVYNPAAGQYLAEDDPHPYGMNCHAYSRDNEPRAVVQKAHRFSLLTCCVR